MGDLPCTKVEETSGNKTTTI